MATRSDLKIVCHLFIIAVLLFHLEFVKSEKKFQLDRDKEGRSFLIVSGNKQSEVQNGKNKNIGESVKSSKTLSLKSGNRNSTKPSLVARPAMVSIGNKTNLASPSPPADAFSTPELVKSKSKVSNAQSSEPFQYISKCGCQRKFFYPFDPYRELIRLNSSCSDEGTLYTANQKVVSFSLSSGAVERVGRSIYDLYIPENLLRIRHLYPGYSMRLYTDLPLDSTFCRDLCANPNFFWCDIRNSIGDQSQMLPSTWKFLPLGDPTVKLFLSRDISTFINERDVAAVKDWLSLNNKTFHVLRDKRRLHNYPMMGGLWGARNDLLPEDEADNLRQLIISMSQMPRNKGYKPKSLDQDILSRVIFYPKKKEIVAYDSYHCKQWKKFTMVRPFPVRRNSSLVEDGLVTGGKDSSGSRVVSIIKKRYKVAKCPVECRPSYGKDWTYC